MAIKSSQRPPLRLDQGEFTHNASTYYSPEYNTHPTEMSNCFIDINHKITPSPSWSLVGELIRGMPSTEDEKIEDHLTLSHQGVNYVIVFIVNEKIGKRYYSIINTSNLNSTETLPIRVEMSGDIIGKLHVQIAPQELGLSKTEYATLPWQALILVAGNTDLLFFNSAYQLVPYMIDKNMRDLKTTDGTPIKFSAKVHKCQDFAFMQGRLWVLFNDDDIAYMSPPEPNIPKLGQRILGSNLFKIDNFITVENDPNTSIDYKMYLEYQEVAQTITPMRSSLVVGTNKAIRIYTHSNIEDNLITISNQMIYKLMDAECNGVKPITFYNLIVIPTKDSLIHRQIAAIETRIAETTESQLLRVFNDDQEVLDLSFDYKLHILLAKLADGNVKAFAPPLPADVAGGLLSPVTTYMKMPTDFRLANLYGNNSAIVDFHNEYGERKILLFERRLDISPPLVWLNSEPRNNDNSYRWKILLASVELKDESYRLHFGPHDFLSDPAMLGGAIVYNGKLARIEREETTSSVYVIPITVAHEMGITESTRQITVSFIPSGSPAILQVDRGDSKGKNLFFCETDVAEFTFREDASGSVDLSLLVYGVAYICTYHHSMYAYESNIMTITSVVPVDYPPLSQYSVYTSLTFRQFCDIAPVSDLDIYPYHCLYKFSRSTAQQPDILKISITPKLTFELQDFRKINIETIR